VFTNPHIEEDCPNKVLRTSDPTIVLLVEWETNVSRVEITGLVNLMSNEISFYLFSIKHYANEAKLIMNFKFKS